MFANRTWSVGLANDMGSLFVEVPFSNERFSSCWPRCSVFSRAMPPTCALPANKAEGLSLIGACRVIISPGLCWGKHFDTCVDELGLRGEGMSCLLNDDSLKTVVGDFCPWLKVNKGVPLMICVVSPFIPRPIVLLSCVWQVLFSGSVLPSRALFLSNAVSIFSRSAVWDEFRVKAEDEPFCESTVLRTLGSAEIDVVAFDGTPLVRVKLCPLFLFISGCLTWLCSRFLENTGIICAPEELPMLPDAVRSGSRERKTRLLVKWGTKGVDDWENNGEAMGVVFPWLTVLLSTFGDCVWVDAWDNINWDAEEKLASCLIVSCERWMAKGLQRLNWGGADLVKLLWFEWVACWSLLVGYNGEEVKARGVPHTAGMRHDKSLRNELKICWWSQRGDTRTWLLRMQLAGYLDDFC